MYKINDEVITSKVFAYDGCHKIYLIESDSNAEDNIAEATELGYDICDISLLLKLYVSSCELRFIYKWDDMCTTVVPQNTPNVKFDGFDLEKNAVMLRYDIQHTQSSHVLTRTDIPN